MEKVRKLQGTECGNRIEEFQRWVPTHLGLANMANVVAKAISKLLLGQLLRTAQVREFGSDRLRQRLGLSLLVGTDGFGHSPYSFA
jgi:hypothetical protein